MILGMLLGLVVVLSGLVVLDNELARRHRERVIDQTPPDQRTVRLTSAEVDP